MASRAQGIGSWEKTFGSQCCGDVVYSRSKALQAVKPLQQVAESEVYMN